MSGAELLVATMDGIESGELVPRPQPPDGVSLAPKITSDDARVRWDQPAPAVEPPGPRVHPRPRGLDPARRGQDQAVAVRWPGS